MARLRLLLAILIIATLCYVNLIESAVIRSEEFAEQLQRLALDVGPENLRTQRAIETTGVGKSGHRCYSGPCAWEVYDRTTRQFDYFMKNTCVCPKDWTCVRSDEDLSVGAYVFRCREEVTLDDKELPDDAN